MSDRVGAALSWLGKWWKLVVGVVGTLGAFLLAMLAWGAWNRPTSTTKATVQLELAKQRIKELQRERQLVLEQDERDNARVETINKEIENVVSEINEISNREDLSANDLDRLFTELGY